MTKTETLASKKRVALRELDSTGETEYRSYGIKRYARHYRILESTPETLPLFYSAEEAMIYIDTHLMD